MVELLSCVFVFVIMVLELVGVVDQVLTNKYQKVYWRERSDYFARKLLYPTSKSKGAGKGSKGGTPAGQSASPKSPQSAQPPEAPSTSRFDMTEYVDIPKRGPLVYPQVGEPEGAEIETDKLLPQPPSGPAPNPPAVDTPTYKPQ